MKTVTRRQFLKDARKLPPDLANRLAKLIRTIKAAPNMNELPAMTKLKGHKTAFRFRLGDYRAGLFIEDDTVYFERILPRKDIYKKFP